MKSALFVVVAALLVLAAQAHPGLWGGCPGPKAVNQGHPVSPPPRAFHKGPKQDSKIVFKPATATYCPGRKLAVTVTLPAKREFMLTTSIGRFESGSFTCGGQKINTPDGRTTNSFKTVVVIPANAKASLVLKITSAGCKSCSWYTNQITIKPGSCRG